MLTIAMGIWLVTLFVMCEVYDNQGFKQKEKAAS